MCTRGCLRLGVPGPEGYATLSWAPGDGGHVLLRKGHQGLPRLLHIPCPLARSRPFLTIFINVPPTPGKYH